MSLVQYRPGGGGGGSKRAKKEKKEINKSGIHSCQPSRDVLDSPGISNFDGVSRDPGIGLLCPGISCFIEICNRDDLPM